MNFSVLIPYRPTHRIRVKSFDWILRRYEKLLPEAELCVADSSDEEFSRSEARNNAYALATTDILLVADADTVPERDAILSGIELLDKQVPWVVPYSTYYNLGVDKTQEILKHGPHLDIEFEEADCEHIVMSTAGMLLMRRSAWETVGGYDERFIGWGYEDNAFQLALDILVGRHERVHDGRGIHLWHPEPETVRFNQPMIQHNKQLFDQYVRASRRPERMRKLVDERLHV